MNTNFDEVGPHPSPHKSWIYRPLGPQVKIEKRQSNFWFTLAMN
jgi:hypothetical protein